MEDTHLAGTSYSNEQRGWLVKVDAVGSTEWTKIYGEVETIPPPYSISESIKCVVQTSDGGYALRQES